MTTRLTPQSLASLADAPDSPAWNGQARQMLKWAADAIAVAEEMAGENAALNARIAELEARQVPEKKSED